MKFDIGRFLIAEHEEGTDWLIIWDKEGGPESASSFTFKQIHDAEEVVRGIEEGRGEGGLTPREKALLNLLINGIYESMETQDFAAEEVMAYIQTWVDANDLHPENVKTLKPGESMVDGPYRFTVSKDGSVFRIRERTEEKE